ncbi:MAG: hypothetical protein FJX40_15380 [Alphaproteobacteria bacterium]|nr:hypothetical protein [Alphaproteobacteria bacterium]MBM3642543.1 hypothetical protein [Alphaproteobacteria bacterium]
MADEFARLKFDWIECVASDAEMPANASRLAIMICMHLNRRTGSSRVGLDLLAMELGMSKRGIQKLVEALERHGHIEISRGGGGRAVSEYRPKLPIGYRPLLERIRVAREKAFTEASRGEHAFTSNKTERGERAFTSKGERGERAFTSKGERGEPAFTSPDATEVNGCSERGERAFTQTLIRTLLPLKSPKDANDDDANFEWSAFEAVWQFEMNDRRCAAKKSFEGLSESDRRLAIERAPAYLRKCAERGSKRRHASRWLRDKGFLDAALSRPSPAAQRLASEPITTERGVFIRISTDQWRAWSRADGNIPPLNTKFGVGCYRPSEWPPGEHGLTSPAPKAVEAAEHQP